MRSVPPFLAALALVAPTIKPAVATSMAHTSHTFRAFMELLSVFLPRRNRGRIPLGDSNYVPLGCI